MELQWPLILFTTLLAWSAGLFATQCAYALRGAAPKAQMSAWITSAVLLVVGGVAVFMHLEHWERIFNGFGHLTSGITQELIAIVVLAVVAVVFAVYLRRGTGKVPAWVCVAGIVVSAVLLVVMAHSYMMAARPAWDSVFQILSIVGAACVMGPGTMAAIDGFTAGKVGATGAAAVVDARAEVGNATAVPTAKLNAVAVLAGSVANAVTTLLYIAVMSAASSAFVSMGHYFDPTHPTQAVTDVALLTPFGGGLPMTLLAIIAALLAVVCALVGKKQGSWKVWGLAAAVCGCVGAIALRVLFYQMGGSVFLYF